MFEHEGKLSDINPTKDQVDGKGSDASSGTQPEEEECDGKRLSKLRNNPTF
jgi:hypothetical protein